MSNAGEVVEKREPSQSVGGSQHSLYSHTILSHYTLCIVYREKGTLPKCWWEPTLSILSHYTLTLYSLYSAATIEKGMEVPQKTKHEVAM